MKLEHLLQRLGAAIINLLAARGESPCQLAERAQLAPERIGEILAGRALDLDLGTLQKICEALDVPPRFSLTGARP